MAKTTFGPVASRRFGLSLGIDLSPNEKCCNFDCLYCELPKAQKQTKILNPPSREEILKDIEASIKQHPKIEVLTITANGEPTLYKDLKELVLAIKKHFPQKLMILSNASTIGQKDVRDVLKLFDEVKLSLDTVLPKTFKKIDRPVECNIEEIIKGIENFNKEFKNLVVEILVVAGVNDKKEEFQALNKVLQKLDLKRVDIGTIDRPPAYSVRPVSKERLEELSTYLTVENINIVQRKVEKKKSSYTESEIIETLKKRPFSEKEVATLFDFGTVKTVEKLIAQGVIVKEKKDREFFYKTL